MMKYNEWKLLTESVMPGFNLGLAKHPTVGGLVGSHFQEAGFGEKDHDDEDEDDDDFDDEDEFGDEEGDEEGLEGDLLGADEEDGIKGSKEGPDLGFPPDDSDDMGDADGMDDVLGDIDPELAGLGGDEMGGDLGDLEAELGGGDEMGGMGDELGGLDLGDEMGGMGDELGGLDLGDEMGGMGDELGGLDDMGGLEGELGDEFGDEMGPEEPCPECNPDGAEDMGDPHCELCGGEGFVGATDDMGEIDAELESPEEAQMADFMRMMGSYQSKYMGKDCNKMMKPKGYMKKENTFQVVENPLAAAGPMMARIAANPMAQQAAMGAATGVGQAAGNMMNRMTQPQQQQQQQQMMKQYQRKYMTKIAADDDLAKRHGGNSQPHSGTVRRPNHPISVKSRSFMSKDGCNKYMNKGGCCESIVGTTAETHEDFLSSLSKNVKGEVRQKFSSGLVEDALFEPVNSNDAYQTEPQPGQAGFAPSGRVGGAIGSGGYTQDDMTGIPTLGESKKRFPTLTEYLESKNR